MFVKKSWSSDLLVFFLVEIPKGRYNGQKLTKLVSTKMAARASKTNPKMPEITFPMNKPEITAWTMSLIILSVDPMFGIIVLVSK